MIDWQKTTPKDFGSLCAQLIELNGFTNVQWYSGSGGDKGSDFIAQRAAKLL